MCFQFRAESPTLVGKVDIAKLLGLPEDARFHGLLFQEEDIRRRTSAAGINADAASTGLGISKPVGGAAAGGDEATQELAAAVESLPKLLEQKKGLEMHTNILKVIGICMDCAVLTLNEVREGIGSSAGACVLCYSSTIVQHYCQVVFVMLPVLDQEVLAINADVTEQERGCSKLGWFVPALMVGVLEQMTNCDRLR